MSDQSGRTLPPGTSDGWGACKACGHPQHVHSGCYKPMTGRRCECPPQPKEQTR